MKKILLIIILICSFIATYLLANKLALPHKESTPNKQEQNNGNSNVNNFEYNVNNNLHYVLLNNENFAHYILKEQNFGTISEFAEQNNLLFAINTSYFLSDYTHAGLLVENGELLSRYAKGDRQLTHIVKIESGRISFLSPEEFEQVTDFGNSSYFQVGPLFISNSEISSDLISNSLNGNGQYLRTFVCIFENKAVIGVNTNSISLINLAESLKNVFNKPDLSCMNLDGGSSSALYSKHNSELNFGISKRIPYLLGYK